MDINRITLKISYRDLVLFLKAAEFNSSIMDNNYTEKINNMTNQDRRGNKNVLTENEMNPIEGNNITRASELLRSSKKISLTKRITEKEQKCSKNDVVIDKGMGTMELETSGLQIVI
jgi:non-homologous end joining protein Ku